MVKKVLNLYAGIGGNRKLWSDVDVTAVELNPEIAKIYHDFFPDDKVIVADAHQYLLDHYADGWDFIWSSPPCPTHSRLVRVNEVQGNVKYPDMKLYEEIILLTNFCDCKFSVENVIGYYEPLIKPQEIGNHYYWSNFIINQRKEESRDIAHFDGLNSIDNIKNKSKKYDFDLEKYNISLHKKEMMLKNCVEPETGLHIFNMAFKHKQTQICED